MRLVVVLYNLDRPDEEFRISYDPPTPLNCPEMTAVAQLAFELGARWGKPHESGVRVKHAQVDYT